MYEYTKIETPFKRDEDGSKKLLEKVFRNETVEYLADSKWIATEKIDGTNIGVVWDGHKVSFQGRTERSSIPAHLMNRLLEIFGGHETEELFEQKFGSREVILYGEGYGAKIQKGGGNYVPDGCDFILFDVYFPESDLWLKRESIEDIATSFGIKAVPVVYEGNLWEAIEIVKQHPVSYVAQKQMTMEGFVMKPAVEVRDRFGNRVMVKVKVCDFKEESR